MWAGSGKEAMAISIYLPVNPTFLRQIPQRFFFFFESLSPSLSSWSSLMEVPAISLVALALASGSFYSEDTDVKSKLEWIIHQTEWLTYKYQQVTAFDIRMFTYIFIGFNVWLLQTLYCWLCCVSYRCRWTEILCLLLRTWYCYRCTTNGRLLFLSKWVLKLKPIKWFSREFWYNFRMMNEMKRRNLCAGNRSQIPTFDYTPMTRMVLDPFMTCEIFWEERENRRKNYFENLLYSIQNIDRLELDCRKNRIQNGTWVALDLIRAPFLSMCWF